MASLLESLANHLGQDQINQLANQIGATPDQTRSGIGATLPTILAGLARNAQQPEGAQQLDSALAKNHDGSLLDHLGTLFGGNPQSAPVPDKAVQGGSILDHVLGGRQQRVADSAARGSGLSQGQILKLMAMLAPVVLAYLGRRRKEENLSPAQLGETLQRESAAVDSAGGGMISRMLDQDGDGDFDVMDVMKFGMKRMFG